jgi:nitrate reductase assembly molybdenum cofactor insertion protein NarJ
VTSVQTRIREAYGEAMEALDDFIALLPRNDLCMLQELFTRSFDVQAVTTLDIGYVMFGDDYKRGELLSNLNREHVAHQVDCGHELADHLPNVLKLMSKLKDEELLLELVNEIVAPALHTMIGEFDHGRIDKKNTAYRKHYKTLIEAPSQSIAVATAYQHSLRALYQVLKKDFNIVERIQVANTSDFLASVYNENEIEDKAHAFY